MTQEVLAERCGLSADTIRRLEHGSFSPSLDTLRKLCAGLDLLLSQLFEAFELGERTVAHELDEALARLKPEVRQRVLDLVHELAGSDGDDDCSRTAPTVASRRGPRPAIPSPRRSP